MRLFGSRFVHSVLLGAVLTAANVFFASAATIYSNVKQPIGGQDGIANYNGTGRDADGNLNVGPLYNSFESLSGPIDTTLTEVELSLYAEADDDGSIDVALYANNAGIPGALLENLGTIDDNSLALCLNVGSSCGNPVPTLATLNGLSVDLAPDTTYWIGLSADPVNGSSALWNFDPDIDSEGGRNIAGNFFANYSSGVLASYSDDVDGPYEMRLIGDNTPEPSTFMLLGAGSLVLLAGARLSGKRSPFRK